MWNKATGAVNTYKSALDEATAAASRLAAASGGGGGSSYTPTPTTSVPMNDTASKGGSSDKTGGKKKYVKYYIYRNNGTLIGTANNTEDVKRAMSGLRGQGYWEKEYYAGSTRVREKNVYHKGLDAGFVGNVKGNEEFVKALKGEAFVTRAQQDRFMNNILPDIVSKTSTYGGATFDNLLNINVQGNLDSSVVPDIERISNDVFKRLNKAMFQGGYKRNTNTVSI